MSKKTSKQEANKQVDEVVQPEEINNEPDETGQDADNEAGTEDSGQETPDEAQTPDEGEAKQDAADDEIFAANPKLDVYYRTADGAAFYTDNAAGIHAMKLEDKTVTKVVKK